MEIQLDPFAPAAPPRDAEARVAQIEEAWFAARVQRPSVPPVRVSLPPLTDDPATDDWFR